MQTADSRTTPMPGSDRYVIWLSDPRAADVAAVGGKNASLGEMTQKLAGEGIAVPDGFAVGVAAYGDFVEANGLRGVIEHALDDCRGGRLSRSEAAAQIRARFLEGKVPPVLSEAILAAYRELGRRAGVADLAVAVRSSATAEDLPGASFAGQLESFLNVRGDAAVLDACRRCLASLFTERAVLYRDTNGFDHLRVALSIVVQRMIRADQAAAVVMYSIDTETGFPRVVLVDAAWGLAESVVQGVVDPDEYVVFKPLLDDSTRVPIVQRRLGAKLTKTVYAVDTGGGTRMVPTSSEERRARVLSDEQILTLARWAVAIERHYGWATDIEWALDGPGGDLYIVQARPETAQGRRHAGAPRAYTVTPTGARIVSGLAIGDGAAAGRVCQLDGPSQIDRFPKGAVLVAQTTDPDWLPVMARAAAIVTEHGGRTSH